MPSDCEQGPDRTSLVEQYFAAMQQGPDGFDALVSLFADDAVYREPFSGLPEHHGQRAIARYLAAAAPQAPPELRIFVERLDVAGDTVTAVWRCESTIFAQPSRGQDVFTVRRGKIVRLETTLLDEPVLQLAREDGTRG